MSQPPPSDHGNVVDPKVLAQRRAARAEGGEELSPEQRLFELERRLGEVAAERDALRTAVQQQERELRAARQREWAEQQQRLEAQGETAATRELAGSQVAQLRERLAETEAEVAVLAAERDRARTALQQARAGQRVERDRRTALEGEHARLRAELQRHEALSGAAAEAMAAAGRELARERAARVDVAGVERRLSAERQVFVARVAAVEGAVAAVRERLGAAAAVLRERLAAEREARVAVEGALGGEREARLAAEGALGGEREARLAAEGALGGEREARLAAEGALGGEREARLAAEEALVGERAGAEAASARIAELERELQRRDAVEAQLRAALDGLHGELEAVRAGDGERSARLAGQVESVLAIAAGLRDGLRRELGAEQEAFAASLAAMQERVTELQAGAEAHAATGEELEAERAARWVAEAELDAERRRGDADRAARAVAESRLAEVEAELDDLRAVARPPAAPDPAALASLRDALSHLRTDAPAADREPSSLGLDLAAAAARLRSTGMEAEADVIEAAEAEIEAEVVAVEREPEPEAAAPEIVAVEPKQEIAAVKPEPETVEPEPEAVEPEPEPVEPAPVEPEPEAVEPEPEPIEREPEPVVVEPEPVAAEPEPAWDPDPEPVVAASATSTAPPAPAGQRLPPRPAVGKSGPWLRDALAGLVADEPDIAELLFIALLPAQAGAVKQPLAYELAVDGGTTHRVAVDADRALVELPGHDPTEARIAGPLAALVPLAAGGAGRRLPGTQIDGRRSLRRLLKARRAPLSLSDLAASGVAPSPGLLLTVLARSVPAAWTADRPLSVDVAPEGADAWRVVATGGSPLLILPTDPQAPAPATLHTAAGRLPAVLAGTAAARDARVDGDLEAVQTLLSWFDRAQRGKR